MDEPGTRAAIGRALLELLAEGRAISYGAAATRAGVSKGLVQHYFPDRSRLVRFAAATLAARLEARVRDAVADPAAGAAATLTDALVALLPATPESRLDEAAGRALFALALTDPETNRSYREGRRAITGVVRDLLAAAAPHRGPDGLTGTARDLLGTLGELATDLVLGELSAAEASAALRARVREAVG